MPHKASHMPRCIHKFRRASIPIVHHRITKDLPPLCPLEGANVVTNRRPVTGGLVAVFTIIDLVRPGPRLMTYATALSHAFAVTAYGQQAEHPAPASHPTGENGPEIVGPSAATRRLVNTYSIRCCRARPGRMRRRSW